MSKSQQRIIALVDCDCFFVSCERVDNPALCGKPVCVVTNTTNKGIVLSRSKEAKALGIKMGQPMFQLAGLHPSCHYIPCRHERYGEISKAVMSILRSFTPDVEVVSIDEAFMDVTGLNALYGISYTQLITNIRAEVLRRTKVPVSIGLCSSKRLAKLASDKAKETDGIYVIRPTPDTIMEKVGDTPIKEVSGIGKQNAKRLWFNGIGSIREFVSKDDTWIKKVCGIGGITLKYELLGKTVSPVNPDPEAPQSIQDTHAFVDFTTDLKFLHASLLGHIHRASKKLRAWDGYCGSIAVMLRTKDFAVFQQEIRLGKPTNSEKTLTAAAHNLLDKLYRKGTIYRASGITLANLSFGKAQQLSLFDAFEPEDDKLSRTLDLLENKFGAGVIKRGGM